jgi:hypothetical protein
VKPSDERYQPPRHQFLNNIILGILWGLALALFYSLFVIIVYLFEGTRRFDANQTSILTVIASYFLGGLGGGAVVGALLPLTRWLLGSAIVGVVAVIPITTLIQMADINAGLKQGFNVRSVLEFSLYFGAAMGIAAHLAKKAKWF